MLMNIQSCNAFFIAYEKQVFSLIVSIICSYQALALRGFFVGLDIMNWHLPCGINLDRLNLSIRLQLNVHGLSPDASMSILQRVHNHIFELLLNIIS